MWQRLLSLPVMIYAALAGSAARGGEPEERERMRTLMLDAGLPE